MVWLYLHGLGSSPASSKAQFLQGWLQALGQTLLIPDLNQGDFQGLTLTRQLRQVEALLPEDSAVMAIGSSLGGLTAAWLAQRCSQVHRLVLLAPAFGLAEYLPAYLGETALADWQRQGYLEIYHHALGRPAPLGYGFLRDLERYPERDLTRPVPTLILHGRQDEVIPIQASRTYAAGRPWVVLQELEADHSLGSALPTIQSAIQDFWGGTPDRP